MKITQRKYASSIEVGVRFDTNSCGTCVVTKYVDGRTVHVMFEDTGFRTVVHGSNLLAGKVSDPYARTVKGVGYLGEGKFPAKTTPEGKFNYHLWAGMLERSTCPKFKAKHPSYANVTLTAEWECFQTFCRDITSLVGYGNTDDSGDRWHLDKDLLIPGNDIYGKSQCCFLPREINLIIRSAPGGRELPIGVVKHAKNGNYNARLGPTHLGCFDTPEEAFGAYAEAKEQEFKRLARKYKTTLSPKAFRALLNRKVTTAG